MPVILVIIVAVAWIAILAPNMMRRRTRLGDGISSISHFHHQLRVLEHSAPEPIVAPAYRLRTVDGDTVPSGPDGPGEPAAPVLTVVGADQLPRPALAFLGRDGDEPAVEAGPPPGGLPRGALTAGALPPGTRTPSTLPPSAGPSARHRVRRRRRDTLGVLTTVFVITLMIGILPAARAAWMVCALSGAAMAAYVALLVRLRRVADERDRKLRYLANQRTPAAGRATAEGPWAGRFAHPSQQALAAR